MLSTVNTVKIESDQYLNILEFENTSYFEMSLKNV